MTDSYTAISQVIEAAGFYTVAGATMDDGGHRLICASKKLQGGGYSGNSFWIARRINGWFLGTWGPHLYKIPDPNRVAELCVAWLTLNPRALRPDIDQEIKVRFELVEVEDDEVSFPTN